MVGKEFPKLLHGEDAPLYPVLLDPSHTCGRVAGDLLAKSTYMGTTFPVKERLGVSAEGIITGN
jgi:hypothetical protein